MVNASVGRRRFIGTVASWLALPMLGTQAATSSKSSLKTLESVCKVNGYQLLRWGPFRSDHGGGWEFGIAVWSECKPRKFVFPLQADWEATGFIGDSYLKNSHQHVLMELPERFESLAFRVLARMQASADMSNYA